MKKLLTSPIVDYDLSLRYAEKRHLAKATKHYLQSAVAHYKANGRVLPRSFLYCHENSKPEPCDRNVIHSAIVNCARENMDQRFIKDVISPLYNDFWRDLMFGGEMFGEALDVSTVLCEVLDPEKQPLFDKAFCLNRLGKTEEAEQTYGELLEHKPDNSAARHNLSIIVEKRGDLEQALNLSQQAVELSPDDELYCERYDRLKQNIEECRVQEERREDFLRTARERYSQLDYYKRKILATLIVINRFDDLDHLAKLSGSGERYIEGNWRKLVEQGMIIENSDGAFIVNPHIVDLVKKERSHAVATTIIRAGEDIAFKPIFNSNLEYTIYNLIIGLFPNHLVFPNMALQTIFQYDRMKMLLDGETFRYFLMSQVDFCLTSTANYLPVIAFEVDSHYHDQPEQKERDQKKNNIFNVGGVPLLRLRAYGRPSEGAIRQDIVNVIQQLGNELTVTNERSQGMVNLALEIDFERFGSMAGDSRIE